MRVQEFIFAVGAEDECTYVIFDSGVVMFLDPESLEWCRSRLSKGDVCDNPVSSSSVGWNNPARSKFK